MRAGWGAILEVEVEGSGEGAGVRVAEKRAGINIGGFREQAVGIAFGGGEDLGKQGIGWESGAVLGVFLFEVVEPGEDCWHVCKGACPGVRGSVENVVCPFEELSLHLFQGDCLSGGVHCPFGPILQNWAPQRVARPSRISERFFAAEIMRSWWSLKGGWPALVR